MVQLECIEDDCLFKTQNLPFENAQKILQMHLEKKHPPAYNLKEVNKKLDHIASLFNKSFLATDPSEIEENTSLKRTKRELQLDFFKSKKKIKLETQPELNSYDYLNLEEDKHEQEHQTDESASIINKISELLEHNWVEN